MYEINDVRVCLYVYMRMFVRASVYARVSVFVCT